MNSGALSVEGILMMIVAFFLDSLSLLGLIIEIIVGVQGIYMGIIFSFIPSLIGYLIIGSWTIFRFLLGGEGNLKSLLSLRNSSKSISQPIIRRFLFSSVGKFIPFIQNLPFWTIYVYNTLK